MKFLIAYTARKGEPNTVWPQSQVSGWSICRNCRIYLKSKMLGGQIQTPIATNSVFRFMKIAAAVPWESGKRPLFYIFSMASFQKPSASLDRRRLLHLYLEPTVPHISLVFCEMWNTARLQAAKDAQLRLSEPCR